MRSITGKVRFWVAGVLVVFGALSAGMIWQGSIPAAERPSLVVVYPPALRGAMEKIAASYERTGGMAVKLEAEDAQPLPEPREGGVRGDVVVMEQARAADLVEEPIELAKMRAVIAVPKGNPKVIKGVLDLLREDVRVAVADPEISVNGKVVRELLKRAGKWQALEKRIRAAGVVEPSVVDVAAAVRAGRADAGIVWDAKVVSDSALEAVRADELEGQTARIAIAVPAGARDPKAAETFVQYVLKEGREALAEAGYREQMSR